MCPLSPGKSRVFLFNARASIAPSSQQEDQTFFHKLKRVLQPKTWKSSLRSLIIAKVFDPRRVSSHMVLHKIFDGDGVFLHKQGQRMAQAGLTFRDYSTPGSCDILVNGYRRYLHKVAKSTERLCGHARFSDAVAGTPNAYDSADLTQRSLLLDRYFSHTVNCPVCQRALHRWRGLSNLSRSLAITLQGAAGAATAFALISFNMARQGLARPLFSERSALVVGVSAWGLSFMMHRIRLLCDGISQRFVFQDYVHASKD